LGVILSHANWDILKTFMPGDPSGYPFVVIDQYGKFSVPAFLFISGYFIAYAIGRGKNDLKWKILRQRLTNLIRPWIIWSTLWLLGQRILGHDIHPGGILFAMFVQYYFVALLIAYLLISPWITRWACKNWRSLLATMLFFQLAGMIIFYLRVYWVGYPENLNAWVDTGPFLLLNFALYFPLGLIGGMFALEVRTMLEKVKGLLPWFVLIFFVLSVMEGIAAFNLGGDTWPVGASQMKFTSVLFSISLFLTFLSVKEIKIPGLKKLSRLSKHTYGFYLLHYFVLGLLTDIFEQFLSKITSIEWVYLPILFILTLMVCWAILEGIRKFPRIRRIYPYLFG
jgi:peptidoglycan/LPS O-acetylase OafA/YrhL